MKISLRAANLLKHVVSHNGQHELNAEGKEVPSLRRLNGEETSQRRFFARAYDVLVKDAQPVLDAALAVYNDKLKEKKDAFVKTEGEEEEAFNARVTAVLVKDEELKSLYVSVARESENLQSEKHEMDLSSKTGDFLKKYFVLFGDEAGFLNGDDDTVVELNELFGL